MFAELLPCRNFVTEQLSPVFPSFLCKIVDQLLNKPCHRGETPIFKAVSQKNARCVALLAQQAENVQLRTRNLDRKSIIELADELGDVPCQLLVSVIGKRILVVSTEPLVMAVTFSLSHFSRAPPPLQHH